VYYTPPSSEFDVSDVPHFLENTTPPTDDPMTSDASSLREELSSLREELEEAKRENRNLNAELADYGRSLRELEVRHQRLLEVVTKSNKAQQTLMQNVASIAVCYSPSLLLIRD